MPKTIYSYKTIPSEAIQITWYVYNAMLPKDCVIKRWKKNLNLELSLRAFLNNKAITQSVSENSSISFYICYHSLNKLGGTSLHGLAKKVPYRNSDEPTQDIIIDNIIIPGEEIAGATEITFYAVLEKPESIEDVTIFAKEKGAILFEQSVVLQLEGNQFLFPVKAIDFNDNPDIIGKKAFYYLRKKFPQLDSNFSSAYTLYLNTRHPFFNKLNSEDEKDLASSYLLKMIMYDVYRTIVEDALNPDTGLIELMEPTEEIYTLRAVYSGIITNLINLYFPSKNLEAMKRMLHSDETSRNALFTAIQDYYIGE